MKSANRVTLLLVVAIAGYAARARADIGVTLYSGRDATHYSHGARQYGASNVMVVGTVGAATGTHAGSAGTSRRGLVWFNTGGIPSTASITGATAYFWQVAACCTGKGYADATRSLSLYRIGNGYPWPEGG